VGMDLAELRAVMGGDAEDFGNVEGVGEQGTAGGVGGVVSVARHRSHVVGRTS
jgi:hypothetical protein